MLHVNDLSYRVGGRLLFEGATLAVPPGHRVGLVGRNGTGKTTLLNLVAGDLQPDSGTITVRRGARFGRVAQEAPNGPASLLDTVLAADGERTRLLGEADTATDPNRIAEVHTRLTDIDAHSAPARAASILAGLGFDEAEQSRPCSEFSGGWRMRVSLAAALFAQPDLLLLDEPTNHLDLEATMWLQTYLAAWPGTLVVISHDRNLLNTVVSEIAYLHDLKLQRYVGGYDRFERTRREQLTVQTKMQARQQSERRRIEAFVNRFRAQATKARQAQSRIKMLARMEPIAAALEERTVVFRFPQPNSLPPPIVALDAAAVGYAADTPVLGRLNLRIDMDDRIGLLGANGNGKSTLVKLLAGHLTTMAGSLHTPRDLRIGYVGQDQADSLDPEATPLTLMRRRLEKDPDSKIRGHLGGFGFVQEKAETPVAALSGGEKARLLFAMMSVEAPHLMLLDEPTNHLDVDAREALVQALNDYEGAVVLVSHDPHIIDLVCDRLWLVADGSCDPFDGDLDDYRRHLSSERRQQRTDKQGNGRKENRRARAQARAETAAVRAAGREAERRMETLSREKEDLESRLADPEVYTGPTAALMQLQLRLGEVKSALAEAEKAWIEAQEEMEDTG
jgi:ATP-binding cassette, subfamily F, member 3